MLFAAAAALAFGGIKQELTPPEDRASIAISVNAPATVSLDFTQTQMQKVEALLQPYKASGEATSIFSVSGFGSNTNSGFIVMTLADWEHRTRSQQAITAEINGLLTQVPGARQFSIRQATALACAVVVGLQFALVGDNYQTLAETANKVVAELGKDDDKWGRVTTNYETTQPQMTLSTTGRRRRRWASTSTARRHDAGDDRFGSDVGTVFINDDSYSVRMMSTSSSVNDPGDLRVDLPGTPMVATCDVDHRHHQRSAYRSLAGREDQRRAVTVTAALSEGLAAGDAYAEAVRSCADAAGRVAVIPMAEAKTLGESNNGLYHLRLCAGGDPAGAGRPVRKVWSAIIVMATVPFCPRLARCSPCWSPASP